MKLEYTSSGLAKYSILPPNNPERRDWLIFSEALHLDQPEKPADGATSAQAADHMRALLFKCLKSRESFDAIILKCAGGAISRRTNEDTAAKPKFTEVMSFVRTRLWNCDFDGSKTVSSVGRGHSSNDIVLSWNPEAGGIGHYIAVNVSKILNRDWKAATMELSDAQQLSGDFPERKQGHLDSTGRISGPAAAQPENDAPDYVEGDSVLEKAPQNFSVTSKGQASDGENGLERLQATSLEQSTEKDKIPGIRPHEGPPVTELRREFDTALIASRISTPQSEVLRSPQHPDFRVFAAALIEDVTEPELDEPGRTAQLRDLAGRVLAMHCADLDDYEGSREALLEWRPAEVPFARYFPEVCLQVADSLNRVEVQKVRDQPLQLEFAAEFLIIGSEITRQSKNLNPRPQGMSADEWAEITDKAKNWLERECTSSEELLSADRPDYIALCHLTGRLIDRKIEPEVMGERLRTMYREWTDDRFYAAWSRADPVFSASPAWSENRESINEMNKSMETWEPLKDGFAGETMKRHLHQARLEIESREEIARHARNEPTGKSRG